MTEHRREKQLDMRTKEGRGLRDSLRELLSVQQNLKNAKEVLQAAMTQAKELEKQEGALIKSLLKEMKSLEVLSFEIAEGAAMIETVPTYKRVSPAYKNLYEQALSELEKFNSEAAAGIIAASEAEIAAKQAMTKDQLRVVRAESLREAVFGDVIGKATDFVRGLWESLLGALRNFRSAKAAGENFLDIVAAIQ